jgi:hypothetical protein
MLSPQLFDLIRLNPFHRLSAMKVFSFQIISSSELGECRIVDPVGGRCKVLNPFHRLSAMKVFHFRNPAQASLADFLKMENPFQLRLKGV